MKLYSQSCVDGGHTIGVRFDDVITTNENGLLSDVLRRTAEMIAEKWVADHYQEVVANIRPEAVATLVAAEAGAAINKTLREKIPDKVLEVVKRDTEVWQRGILGGMKRVR